MKVAFDYSYINCNKNHVLAGFENRNFSESLGENKLYVSVSKLIKSNKSYYFISIDTLYISSSLKNEIEKIIFNKDIVAQNVIINASHTHSAPNIFTSKFGNVELKFIEILKNRIEKIISNINKNLVTIKKINYFEFSPKNKPFIYRRKKIPFFNIVKMLPNENKIIDDKIRIIEFVTSKNKFKWVSINCHPVLNTNDKCSSDFIGEIRNFYKNECQFFQGFSADIRPNITSKEFTPLKIRKKIFKIFTNVFVQANTESYKIFVNKILDTLKSKPTLELSTSDFELKVKTINKKLENTNVDVLDINEFLLDNTIRIITVNGEISNLYLQSNDKKYVTFPMGCTNGMIGYIPYPNQKNKGYENYHSISNYNLNSPFKIDDLDWIRKKI